MEHSDVMVVAALGQVDSLEILQVLEGLGCSQMKI